jgi:hypothetical protein
MAENRGGIPIFERAYLYTSLKALWYSLTYTMLKWPDNSNPKSKKPAPEKKEKIFIFLSIRNRRISG